MDILEEAIINLDVREKLRRHVEFILSLCTEPVGDDRTAVDTASLDPPH